MKRLEDVTAEPVSFNVNHHVRVRLTTTGRQHQQALGRTYPKEDADGWSDWQLWDLAHTFGDVMYMGGSVPFETEILICPERV